MTAAGIISTAAAVLVVAGSLCGLLVLWAHVPWERLRMWRHGHRHLCDLLTGANDAYLGACVDRDRLVVDLAILRASTADVAELVDLLQAENMRLRRERHPSQWQDGAA